MTAPFDDAAFRRALGHLASGITIVTVLGAGGRPMGLTANTFTSVSLDPPQVLVCVGKQRGSYAAFSPGGVYAVHVLAHEQAGLAARFATPGADKFGGLDWRPGPGGVPILPDCLALFVCRVVHAYDGGDHTIFVGRVEQMAGSEDERLPLCFYRGRYTTVQPPV